MSFQSAFHRGMECNRGIVNCKVQVVQPFSPLFIAAWSATRDRNEEIQDDLTFSPLFIAAWSAIRLPVFQSAFNGVQLDELRSAASILSVRFSSRHGVQLRAKIFTMKMYPESFSPLFIAAWSATFSDLTTELYCNLFQSAFHRGMECNSKSKM